MMQRLLHSKYVKNLHIKYGMQQMTKNYEIQQLDLITAALW